MDVDWSLLSVHAVYDWIDARVSSLFMSFLEYKGVHLQSAPATRGLPTVDSPTPVLLATSSYLSIVLLGVAWLRSFNAKPRTHEPFLLKALVIFHNLFCLTLSLYMCVGIASRAFQLKYLLWGNAYDPNEITMAHYVYLFYMSKYVEFMDTIIMILKHNLRQITVLHVYHHVSVALIWWMISYHAPGGDAYFSGAINSGVHVIMYLYYLLSSLLRSDEKVRRKYLFWGRYLTQIQMLQFVCNWIQAAYCIKVQAPYPQFLYKILFYYMLSLLMLFANFYMRKYTAMGKKKQKYAIGEKKQK
ncbi:hypothetical protein KP509_08G058600 [Ceratopteris richardii]|uniref:Very-long-chain 3-oxoacyl-CoA synthase n=1 Tax=Ceratopteris richardii TaxID=49495 RepID=A0A8T2UGT5_CERRI|nr:hypothetical protein KP509_08G058600 [Ceratopteris richardii]